MLCYKVEEEKDDEEKEAEEEDGSGVGKNGNGDGKRDVNEIDFINNRKPQKKKKHPIIPYVCKHKEPIDQSLPRCNEVEELTRMHTHSQFWEGSSDQSFG